LEITNSKDESYYLNGVLNADLPASLSGYKVTHKIDNKKLQTFHVELGGRQNMVIRVLKDFVSVTIKHGTEKDFGDSLGLMGSFHTGARLARDGMTVIEDVNAFGEEWQVQSSEDMIFQTVDLPQHPEKCIPPPSRTEKRRRLGEGIAEDEAKRLCAKVTEGLRDFCIFDILATNDKDMVSAY
jgi:hypothetical protein